MGGYALPLTAGLEEVRAMVEIYDVAIIGGGPAGLSAGIYAGRAKLRTVMIERSHLGGQIAQTADIENYPGSVAKDSGLALIKRMAAQADNFGIKIKNDDAVDVCLEGKVKKIICQGGEIQARTMIIATGAGYRTIGCPGEKMFTGKGVSYCATCDGAFFEDLPVYVVGGGDAAVEEAVYLTKFARKVTVIHRRNELRAAKSIQEKAFANPKIDFMWDSVVVELKGNGVLESMTVENVKTFERKEIVADEDDGTFGVFVFIGFRPNSELFVNKLPLNNGYIVTDENMGVGIPGVYAAGDVREKSLRQVVTAAADGAIAAVQAERFLRSL